MSGLMVSVYRDANGGDCTNGGITSKHERLLAVSGDGVKVEGPFTPHKDIPTVAIVERNIMGTRLYLTAYPVNEDGTVDRGTCFGGNYIASSDSRFPSDYPIPVHDRKE